MTIERGQRAPARTPAAAMPPPTLPYKRPFFVIPLQPQEIEVGGMGGREARAAAARGALMR